MVEIIMLGVNSQEYEILKAWLPPDTVVVKPEELGTDAVVNGLETNRMYERKELEDFIASVIDRRIFEQLKTLSDNIANGYEPFVILEGQGFYDWSQKKWVSLKQWLEAHPERKMAFFEALTAFRAFKVGLVLTMDKQDTALYLSFENSKLGKPKEKKEYPERGGFRKDMTVAQKQEYWMDAFGHETGKALTPVVIAAFKDLSIPEDSIANLTLKSGRHIGEKKAKEILQVLTE